MEQSNQTSVKAFILLGLSMDPLLQIIYFLIFLMIYVFTLLVNVLLLVVVRVNSHLHTPMYFFLSNLSVIDICFSSTIAPKILVNTLSQDKSISFLGCAAQVFFFLEFAGTECVILAIMAYDRYVAICKPLRYLIIMNRTLCRCLAAMSWIVIFFFAIGFAITTFQLPYCRSKHINHFFCDIPPLFLLSCKDTFLNELAIYICCGSVDIFCFSLTVTSYFYIITTILKIRSSEGRHKAFSTCASHLIVVFIYFGTIAFMYLRPRHSYTPDRDRAASILYTAITPMLNPIIYSIRNKDVIGTLKTKLAIKDPLKWISFQTRGSRGPS
ncbi:olfactory receptor-like protein OLF1 [Leptodactylus fuscus]|uniref:olfactory receptor-like protein OLF1 n=1 Tax=Leptodactylus fuscus TaxID=238119 RepID=UPI003F4EECB8